MRQAAIVFGLILFAIVGLATSHPPVEVIVDSTGVSVSKTHSRARTSEKTRGACLAARSGYEAFCSAHPERELCLAQGGLCRWQEF